MLRQSILALLLFSSAMIFLPTASLQAADPQGHAPVKAGATTDPGGHSGHAEPAGHKVNPLEFQPTLTLWTVVVFCGLLFVLSRFAWNPLLQALQAREEHFEHVLHETEKARNESEALLAEHRRLMANASSEVKSLLEKARQDAQSNADQIVKSAQAEAESSRDRAKREIVVARDQALSEIWNTTANLAVSVAGKVLSKQIGDDDRRRLVENAIQELPQSTSSTNSHGGVPA
jgi:F-type H+-transporting ATPase subunit b